MDVSGVEGEDIEAEGGGGKKQKRRPYESGPSCPKAPGGGAGTYYFWKYDGLHDWRQASLSALKVSQK